MKGLIEALTILQKYLDETYPTACEHDVLYVVGIDEGAVSEADAKRLEELGFIWMDEEECWGSFFYGSA